MIVYLNKCVYAFVLCTVASMFTEYDIAREIQKFQFKTWEFRATSYSVNSQASVSAHINKQEVGMVQKIFSSPTNR